MGMSKHRKSGRVPTNKANAISRSREANKAIEQEEKIRKKKKQKMYSSIKDLFK